MCVFLTKNKRTTTTELKDFNVDGLANGQVNKNASGKTPQTSFTSQSKWGKDQLDNLELN